MTDRRLTRLSRGDALACGRPSEVVARWGAHGAGASADEEVVEPTEEEVSFLTTPMLLKTVAAGTLDPRALITHRFPLDEMERAYTTFGNAAKERALKVVLASD